MSGVTVGGGGAMEVVRVIEEAHEGPIVSLAYNKARREIYSAADGDKLIKAWDSRTGMLLRSQQGHKGMVTSLFFSATVRLLFSGSIDNTVGIWTEKGANLQMMSIGGGPVFSIAWDERRRYLIVGGQAVVNIFRVDLAEARKTSMQQRSAASGLKDGNNLADAPQILKRVYQPLKGPDLCHTDIVNCMVITETGKLITGGYDKSLCIYEFDKLDKPREAFQRIRKCHTSAICSMAYDTSTNTILTGSIDGSMKVWSVEGRLLDKFENINTQPVCVAYIASTNMYWGSGRFGRLMAFDPRAPANVTEYVKEANGMDRFNVLHMFAPLDTDLLLGATKQRQLVIWQHNQVGSYRMFKKHSDWVESLIVVNTTINGLSCEEIFSAGADGIVLRWQLDTEQNCDVYQCVEEIELHQSNIYAMVYSAELECLITGGEDTTIQLYYLTQIVPTFNDVPLPTSFKDHEGKVTGLALLRNKMLASASFDRSIRIWDLTNMKPVTVVVDAHDTPLQCLEYCEEREELATCGMGNKVHVWDVSKPTAVKRKVVLDHSDAEAGGDDESHGYKAKTNMQWLTRSDMAGLPNGMNPLVEEAVTKANRDVPEVTQVRWVPYRKCWVTAADDDMIRLWSPEGHKLHQFTYNGGSVQCLFVDPTTELLVATMLDKNAYVWDLDDPMPRAVYKGHCDIIKGVGYLQETKCFVTASWDKSLRLWNRPSSIQTASSAVAGLQGGGELHLMDEDHVDEDHFVSSYEKAHPLEVPKALLEQHQWALLKAIGVIEDDKSGKRRGKAFKDLAALQEDASLVSDVPGSLGDKLERKGDEMLREINDLYKKAGRGQDTADSSTTATKPSSRDRRTSRVSGKTAGR